MVYPIFMLINFRLCFSFYLKFELIHHKWILKKANTAYKTHTHIERERAINQKTSDSKSFMLYLNKKSINTRFQWVFVRAHHTYIRIIPVCVCTLSARYTRLLLFCFLLEF
jgi:hypothetical protein